MIEQVKAQYKTIDVLVNSAGANPQMVPLEDLEEWAWDTVMNVNLKGIWLVSKEIAKMMNISKNTVKNQLVKAKQIIRAQMNIASML